MEPNSQQQLDRLKGQTLAAHLLLGTLCRVLAETSPATRALVRRAFDKAAHHAELTAIALGKTASPMHTIEALRLVEEMRSAVLRERLQQPIA